MMDNNVQQLDKQAPYNKEFNRTFESLKKPKNMNAMMQNRQNQDIDIALEDKSCRSPDRETSLYQLKQISKIDIA